MEKSGLPDFVVNENEVWISSIGGEVSFELTAPDFVSNVFRVDPRTLTVRRLPIGRTLGDLFVGDGQLWATDYPLDGDRLQVFRVERDGRGLDEKDVPSACKTGEGGWSVVYEGMLWLDCGHRVVVFGPEERGPLKTIPARGYSGLLAADNGLWLAAKDALEAIAGPSTGTRIDLPRGFQPAGDYASQDAWDVEGDEAWAHGDLGPGDGYTYVLVKVDLDRGSVSSTQIPDPDLLYADLAIAGSEVWLAESEDSILRFSRADRPSELGRLRLPVPAPNRDQKLGGISVHSGAGYVWVGALGGEARLFRIDLPDS
jgi:hypothetical protein